MYISAVLNRSLVSLGISVRRTIKSVQQHNSQSEWLPPVLWDRDGVHVRVTSQSLRSTHWTTWQSSRQVSQLQRLIEVHHQNARNLLKIPLRWENTQHCLPNSIHPSISTCVGELTSILESVGQRRVHAGPVGTSSPGWTTETSTHNQFHSYSHFRVTS